MLAKIIVILFLLLILYCLGSALFYLLSNSKSPYSMVKSLSWRIALSVTLFLLLLLAAYLGWLHPHGVS